MKVDNIIPILHYNDNTNNIKHIDNIEKIPINIQIDATVQTVEYQLLTINSNYGLVKIPLPYDQPMIEALIANQNISIGIYDLPDRQNVFQLQIVINSIKKVNNTIYKFLFKRYNNDYQLLKHDDVLDIVDITNIPERKYKLLAIDNAGYKINIDLELNDSGNDQIILRNNDIYINIDDRSYKVIGEYSALKQLLSSGPQEAFITINQVFDLQKDLTALFNNLTDNIPVHIIIDMFLTLQSCQKPQSFSPTNLATYLSVLSPIIYQFRKAKLEIKESRSKYKNYRLIFYLELKEGCIIIIDCFYKESNNYLNIVIRSEYELEDHIKSNLLTTWNGFLSERNLSGSVIFSIQSHQDLCKFINDFSYYNYTYSV